MKRILSIIMVFALSLSLSACGRDEEILIPNPGSSAPVIIEVEPSSTPETNQPEAHVHNFSDATCKTLATCFCGATEGELAEHSWKNANCLNIKVCKLCGMKGERGDHRFNSNRECIDCGYDDKLEIVHAETADERLCQTTPTNTYFDDRTTYYNNYHITFTTSYTVTEFTILGIYEKEVDDYYDIVVDPLYILDKLEPGETFTISTYINDATNNRGFSFVDQYGDKHEYQFGLYMAGEPDDPPFYVFCVN